MIACSIAWCAFSWEAFATLLTGMVAVFAAWSVGRRQVAIAKQQTEILSRQTEIQHLTLRHELFDRRYEVYESTANFLSDILRSGARAETQLENEFKFAMGKSRLLFSPSVHENLREIYKRVWELYTATDHSNLEAKRDGFHNEENLQRKGDHFQWLSDQLISLPQLFEEMNLGDLASSADLASR